MPPPAEIFIGPAQAEDLAAVAALLREAGLSGEDIEPHLGCFLVARDAQGVVAGVVGAEVGGRYALLRSLAVVPAQQGRGVGEALLRRMEEEAGAWGVERWWLLTTTAEKYFAARGFSVVARADAPPAIRATGQFRGAICASAVCMCRDRRRRP